MRLERRKYVNRSNRVKRKICEEVLMSHLKDQKQVTKDVSGLKTIEEFTVFCLSTAKCKVPTSKEWTC